MVVVVVLREKTKSEENEGESKKWEKFGFVENYEKDGDGYVLENLGNWVLLFK